AIATSADAGRLGTLPGRNRTRTSAPRRSKARTTAPPTNPLAPVTSALMDAPPRPRAREPGGAAPPPKQRPHDSHLARAGRAAGPRGVLRTRTSRQARNSQG